jgi:DNA-directed RNA polymerase subunit RPC12/RpoP
VAETKTLKCPNCGANASASGAKDRLTCPYCGASIRVERKAADVAAQASERNAAELALTRLKNEHAAAAAERDRHDAETTVQLASFDEKLEALGRRQGGFRVLLDALGIAMPALVWMMVADDAPVIVFVLLVVFGWWLARNHWKVAGTISGFTWAWSITYVVLGISSMAFFDVTKGPPPWLLPTLAACAIPVAIGWTIVRNARRARKRETERALVQAARAESVAKRELRAS